MKQNLYTIFLLLGFVVLSGNICKAQGEFITRWDLSLHAGTGANQIKFYATTSAIVNYTWTTVPAGTSGSGTFNSAKDTTFVLTDLPAGATIDLSIAPTNFRRFYTGFNTFHDARRLIDVKQWGTTAWTSMEEAFTGCLNLNITAIDLPNLSNVTNMSQMFSNCLSLSGPANIAMWNTTNVTNMGGMFFWTNAFNQDIGNWNTEKVTDMSSMFFLAHAFNQDIGKWNTEKVTDMSGMFGQTDRFNQNLDNWNTSNVNNMRNMFYRAHAFNQDIGNWNTENVTDMSDMFSHAERFNQSIDHWNISKVTDMQYIFNNAIGFNQNLSNWASNLHPDVVLYHAFHKTGLSVENYDALLVGFDKSNIIGKTTDITGLKYCRAFAERHNLIYKKGWTLQDENDN